MSEAVYLKDFNFHQPTKIHFGSGRLVEIGNIVRKYGTRCLLVSTTREEEALRPLYERVILFLSREGITVFHFDRVVPNPTIGSIEEAIRAVKENSIEVIVPVGGGSSIDTAKSIALFHGLDKINWPDVFITYTDPFAEYEPCAGGPLPVISVTTTSGTGSHLTQAMVISDPGQDEKHCIFHDKVFSKETIIDPELMLSLPKGLTAVTGFDAFSHSFESYLNDYASPYTESIALQSMQIIIDVLPPLLDHPEDLELREKMAYADMLSGITLTNAAAGIPHSLGAVIGGVMHRIPHGQCLAVVYPEYVDFIRKDRVVKCARIAALFNESLSQQGAEEAAAALTQEVLGFLEIIGLNKTLSELGCSREKLLLMEQSFLLDVIPWAGRDVLFGMIKNRFQG